MSVTENRCYYVITIRYVGKSGDLHSGDFEDSGILERHAV